MMLLVQFKRHIPLAAIYIAAAILPAILIVKLRQSTVDSRPLSPAMPVGQAADRSFFGLTVDKTVLDFGESPKTGFQNGSFLLANSSSSQLVSPA